MQAVHGQCMHGAEAQARVMPGSTLQQERVCDITVALRENIGASHPGTAPLWGRPSASAQPPAATAAAAGPSFPLALCPQLRRGLP